MTFKWHLLYFLGIFLDNVFHTASDREVCLNTLLFPNYTLIIIINNLFVSNSSAVFKENCYRPAHWMHIKPNTITVLNLTLVFEKKLTGLILRDVGVYYKTLLPSENWLTFAHANFLCPTAYRVLKPWINAVGYVSFNLHLNVVSIQYFYDGYSLQNNRNISIDFYL